MHLLAAAILSFIVYAAHYRKILKMKELIHKIKDEMNDEKFLDKLESKLENLATRVQNIEIKLARIEARMAVIFAGIGIGIQILFKVVWP